MRYLKTILNPAYQGLTEVKKNSVINQNYKYLYVQSQLLVEQM